MNDKWARLNAIWTRRNVTATILFGLLAVGVSLATYLHETEDREIPTETTVSQKATKNSPSVSVSAIHVSAIAMDVPAAFELEIRAGKFSTVPARGLNVVLDFGRAKVEACGYSPKQLITNVAREDKSYRRFEIAELRQNEKLHIRCIIDSPFFHQVVINGDNLGRSETINFSSYTNSIGDTGSLFWAIWLYVVVSVISGILIIYFWTRLFQWF